MRSVALGIAVYFSCVFLWNFSWAQWPVATETAAKAIALPVGILLFWLLVVTPFRAGLRDDPDI